MPYKPGRPCKHPGCHRVTKSKVGFCEIHADSVLKPVDHRKSRHARGYDSKWSRFSKQFLKRNPICVYCGKPATITDHKIPLQIMIEQNGGNTYCDDDYQPLCHACNTRKGATVDRELKQFAADRGAV